MKIIETSVFSFALPLKQPLLLGKQSIRERQGLLLKLTDQSGQIGWGEISPLPSFSKETLEQSLKDIKTLCSEISGFDLSELSDYDTTIGKPLAHLKLKSSVQFGLEMALYKIETATKSGQTDIAVNVNGLIVKLDSRAVSQANELVAAGYKSIKIKIGRTDFEKETELIREISENLPNDVTLRLDGNQSFSLDKAIAFCNHIENCRIEYIEEPLTNPAELNELARQTSIGFALDETLVAAIDTTDDNLIEKLIAPDSIAAIVIKPTLIGSLNESVRLAQLAKETGTTVVISSAYESSLGLATLAKLANLIEPNGVHGLATLNEFESQLTEEVPMIDSGQFIIPGSFSHTPKLSLLEELTYE